MSTQQSITESACQIEYTPTPFRRQQSGTEQSEMVHVVITESQTSTPVNTSRPSPIQQLEVLDNILAVVNELGEDEANVQDEGGAETLKYLD